MLGKRTRANRGNTQRDEHVVEDKLPTERKVMADEPERWFKLREYKRSPEDMRNFIYSIKYKVSCHG